MIYTTITKSSPRNSARFTPLTQCQLICTMIQLSTSVAKISSNSYSSTSLKTLSEPCQSTKSLLTSAGSSATNPTSRPSSKIAAKIQSDFAFRKKASSKHMNHSHSSTQSITIGQNLQRGWPHLVQLDVWTLRVLLGHVQQCQAMVFERSGCWLGLGLDVGRKDCWWGGILICSSSASANV